MISPSFIGIIVLFSRAEGNLFGSPFLSMDNSPAFPSFPSFPTFPSFQSPFATDEATSSQSFPMPFNPFQSAFNSPFDFSPLSSAFGFPSTRPPNTENKFVQTIKVEKTGPDGTKITETVETLGKPDDMKAANEDNEKTSSGASQIADASSASVNPVKVVRYNGKGSTQRTAVRPDNTRSSLFNDATSPLGNGFGRFDNFGYWPFSSGIASTASSASSGNFASSSSTKLLPNGTRITENVTYDSNNPKKVTKVIRRVDPSGKVTITRV